MKFGEFIKQKREERGLSQDELGRLIGFTGSYVSRIENGKLKGTDPEIVKRFAAGLKIKTSDIQTVLYGKNQDRLSNIIEPPKTPIEAAKELMMVFGNFVQVPIVASMHAPGRPVIDYIEIPKSLLPTSHKNICAVRISGGCMSPDVNDGDIVIVDKDDTAEVGKSLLCYHNGDEHPCIIKFKKKSDLEDCELYGVVLWIMKKP